MQKIFEKASSSTQKLSVINGMYPSVSCNHRMRASGHQERELEAKQKAERNRINHQWKMERQTKRFLADIGKEFAKNLIELINKKHPSIPGGEKIRSISTVSIGDILRVENPHLFHSLKAIK